MPGREAMSLAKKIQPVRKDTFGTNRMRKQSVRQGDATFQGCV